MEEGTGTWPPNDGRWWPISSTTCQSISSDISPSSAPIDILPRRLSRKSPSRKSSSAQSNPKLGQVFAPFNAFPFKMTLGVKNKKKKEEEEEEENFWLNTFAPGLLVSASVIICCVYVLHPFRPEWLHFSFRPEWMRHGGDVYDVVISRLPPYRLAPQTGYCHIFDISDVVVDISHWRTCPSEQDDTQHLVRPERPSKKWQSSGATRRRFVSSRRSPSVLAE